MTPAQIIALLIRATIHVLGSPTTAVDDYATKVALDNAITRVATGRDR